MVRIQRSLKLKLKYLTFTRHPIKASNLTARYYGMSSMINTSVVLCPAAVVYTLHVRTHRECRSDWFRESDSAWLMSCDAHFGVWMAGSLVATLAPETWIIATFLIPGTSTSLI
jgi:hypothetical protein